MNRTRQKITQKPDEELKLTSPTCGKAASSLPTCNLTADVLTLPWLSQTMVFKKPKILSRWGSSWWRLMNIAMWSSLHLCGWFWRKGGWKELHSTKRINIHKLLIDRGEKNKESSPLNIRGAVNVEEQYAVSSEQMGCSTIGFLNRWLWKDGKVSVE